MTSPGLVCWWCCLVLVATLPHAATAERAGDGCYHVFLDLGANIGMHARFLFEPQRYPRSQYAQIFSKYFGDSDRSSLACAFEFEPNPKHQLRHEGLVAHYAGRGARVAYYAQAAGAKPANATFYPNNVLHDKAKLKRYAVALHQELGFGAAKRTGVSGTGVTVSVVDVAQFIADEIRGRATTTKGLVEDGKKPPSVVVKMDIEGSEFAVVPRLLDLGVLCDAVDFISIEWHTSEKFLPIDVEAHDGSRVRLETTAAASEGGVRNVLG